MSDYAQIVTFTAKDALTTGNPAKAVKGSELDAELAAISVAILSKYDAADLASQAVAEAGADNLTLMTPLRVAQALAALAAQQTKIKSANETVSNSTTLQDDDHIASISIAANQKYAIEGVLFVQYKVASDFKLLLTCTQTPVTVLIGYDMVGNFAAAASQVDNTTAGALTSAIGDQSVIVKIHGTITSHVTNAGTMKLQWAQNTAVVENTVVLAGSYLIVTPILG